MPRKNETESAITNKPKKVIGWIVVDELIRLTGETPENIKKGLKSAEPEGIITAGDKQIYKKRGKLIAEWKQEETDALHFRLRIRVIKIPLQNCVDKNGVRRDWLSLIFCYEEKTGALCYEELEFKMNKANDDILANFLLKYAKRMDESVEKMEENGVKKEWATRTLYYKEKNAELGVYETDDKTDDEEKWQSYQALNYLVRYVEKMHKELQLPQHGSVLLTQCLLECVDPDYRISYGYSRKRVDRNEKNGSPREVCKYEYIDCAIPFEYRSESLNPVEIEINGQQQLAAFKFNLEQAVERYKKTNNHSIADNVRSYIKDIDVYSIPPVVMAQLIEHAKLTKSLDKKTIQKLKYLKINNECTSLDSVHVLKICTVIRKDANSAEQVDWFFKEIYKINRAYTSALSTIFPSEIVTSNCLEAILFLNTLSSLRHSE